MEVLFNFIFELFKISILSCFYAILIFGSFKIIGYCKPNCWFDRVSIKKLSFLLYSGIVIYVGLFIFMFTYWGDHGLGDSYSIPIGHHKTINYGGGAYIDNDKYIQINFNNFIYDANRIYADSIEVVLGDNQPALMIHDTVNFIDSIEKVFSGNHHAFMIYNLVNDEVIFYQTKEDYLHVAKLYNYPIPDKFENFMTYYNEYWHGWRLFFLP